MYPPSGNRGSCDCRESPLSRTFPGRFLSERSALPRRRRERDTRIEPVELVGKSGAKCRPFLKVEKDAERFAACNALADEIGPINTPKKAFKVIEDMIGDEVNEVFGVMMLDLHLRLKGISETGRGEPSSVMAPLGPTLQIALMNGAHGIVIWHCHPSGVEAEPSQADKDTTKAFAKAAETVNLIFIDHVIIAGSIRDKSFFSFAEEGLL